MKDLIEVIIINIQFLIVVSVISGFIIYNLFDILGYGKPLVFGLIFGGLIFLCTFPTVIRRIKRLEETK